MTKDAKKKPKYEAPVVAPLGELAAAAGICEEGTAPDTSENCTHGFAAVLNCELGGAPGGACGGGGEVGAG